MKILIALAAAAALSSAPPDDADMKACKEPAGEPGIAACLRVLQSKPLTKEREADGQYYLGIQYLQRGRYDEALAALTQAVTLDPKSPDSLAARAAAFTGKKEYDKAFADVSSAFKLDKNSSRAYYARCGIYAEQRKFDQALADCDTAATLKPSAAAFYRRGFVRLAMHQEDAAFADFDRALQINPHDLGALLFRGMIYGKRGDHDHAIADHKAAAALAPGSDEILRALSSEYLFAERRDEAVAEFDALVRAAPNAPAPYLYRAQVYERAKRPMAQVIADLDTAVRLDPSDPHAHWVRGLDLEKTGEFGRAAADFGEAIKLQPGEARYYAQRCTDRARANIELDPALADCNQALHLSPAMWEGLSGRGFVELRLKRYAPALADFNARIELQDPAKKTVTEQAENLLLGGEGRRYPQGSILGESLAQAYCGRSLAKSGLGDKKGAGEDLASAGTIDAAAAKDCRHIFGLENRPQGSFE